MVLQAADTRGPARGLDDDSLPSTQPSASQGASDDGADASQGKHPVHGQAGLAEVARRGSVGQHANQRGLQFVEATAVEHGGGNNRCSREWGISDLLAQLRRDGLDVFDQINLGQGDGRAADAEINKNLQMFFRLGHPAVVGRHHEQGEVNGADAGDHVLHEVFVAGNIDDAEVEW